MSTAAEPPASSMGRRLWTYVVEMFPLQVNVPYALMAFYACYFLLRPIYRLPGPLWVTPLSLVGVATSLGFTLLLRVFDEFKDYEHDLRLFPDRPLPSGRVLPKDLKVLGWSIFVVLTALNAFAGKGLAGYILLMAFAGLMLKFFFLPDLHRKNLLLTLATHNPVVFVSHLYIVSIFLQDFRQPFWPLPKSVWAAIAMFWLMVFAWETSRKIRAAEEEDAYITYSQVLGPRRAALVPLVALTASCALAFFFGQRLDFAPWFGAAVGAAFGYAAWGFLRWLRVQSPAHSKLKPFVETYIIVTYVALIAQLLIKYGVVWAVR